MNTTTTNTLTEKQIAHVTALADQGRDVVIHEIRKALKARSGKAWSVKGGRGTAWGWIEINTTPARATAHCQLKAGAITTNPEDYEMVDTGVAGGSMTETERAELAALLGKDSVHYQGESIAASNAYYRVALAQALYGTAGDFKAEPYWD